MLRGPESVVQRNLIVLEITFVHLNRLREREAARACALAFLADGGHAARVGTARDLRMDRGVPGAARSGQTHVALKRRTDIEGVLAYEIEGIASRNGSGEPFYIDNTAHPANRRLALARSKETHIHAFGLDLDLAGAGNNGHYAPFSWSN